MSLFKFMACLLLISPSVYSQSSETRLSTKMPSSTTSSSDLNNWDFGIALGGGNTTNAVNLSDGLESGYQFIQPEILYTAELNPTSFFIGEVGLSTLLYNDRLASQNADSTTYRGSLSYTQFVDDNFEWGIEAGSKSFYGKEVDFVTGTDEGRDSQFRADTGYVYGRIEEDSVSFEFGAGLVNQDALTVTLNESGQIFEDDFKSFSYQSSIETQVSDQWNLKGSGFFEKKDYKSRQAYFTNGVAPDLVETNPFLREEILGVSIRGRYSIARSLLSLSLSSTETNDIIFGANDSVSTGYSAKFEQKFSKSLTVGLETGETQMEFKNFKADALESQTPNKERMDKSRFSAINVEYDWTGQIKSTLSYKDERSDSDYSIVQFSERKIQTGVKVNF